jgi:predicted dehydrogenase
MKVAIFGSGFGLYGYLPALVGLGCAVVLPERYRAVLESRSELADFARIVEWVADEGAALDRAEALVLARRPADQAGMMADILRRPHLQRLLLEKPLAPDPEGAERLQALLLASGKLFRTGYILGFTDWGKLLIAQSRDPQVRSDLAIHWSFRAHHYATGRHNWKRAHAEGGGALRFYGIQLIALAAEMGFDTALRSTTKAARPGEVESWSASLADKAGRRCELSVDSNTEPNRFAITSSAMGDTKQLDDPFATTIAEGADRRVPLLSSMCAEMLGSTQPALPHHLKTVALWQAIEAITTDLSK